MCSSVSSGHPELRGLSDKLYVETLNQVYRSVDPGQVIVDVGSKFNFLFR